MLSESHVLVSGLRLNRMMGPANGDPLLLLHGVLRRWQTFLPLLPHLAMRWQVHAVDLPGHGASDRSGGDYFVSDYLRVAVDIVRQQFEQPLVIYGHSLGAMVAAGVASELGSRVRAVVLEDPPLETMGSRIRRTNLYSYFAGIKPWAGSTAPREQIARELADLELVDPVSGTRQRLGDAAQLLFMASCLARLDPRVLDPIVESRWLERFNWERAFARLECPALLLQADEATGGMLIDDDARRIIALAKRCTLVRVAGCGHNMHGSRTQGIANLTNSFLESL